MSIFRTAAYTYLFTMLGLLFLPLVSRAQALPSTGFPYTQTGNAYVFSGGTTTAANAGSITFANPANGAVYAQSTQSLPLGGGYTASVQARSVPAKPDVAKAVGNFARGVGGAALKVAGAAYAAYETAKALNDLCNELGYSCYKGADGLPAVSKPDPAGCPTSAGCKMYYINSSWSAPINGPARPSQSAACTAFGSVNGVSTSLVLASGQYSCNWHKPGQQYPDGSIVRYYQSAPAPITPLPSTIRELEDAIASQSGWPTTSALPRVLEQAVASGEPIPLPVPSVTGPLSVPGVPRVTNFPDGSKTTVTPEKQISYGPGSVTVTDREVTTQTSPQGVTTPVQDTAAPAPLPAPAPAQEIEIETCGLPGKPMCAVDGAGAPTGETLDQDQGKRTLDPITEFLADPSSIIPDLPNINWAFALPASCAVIPITGALSDYMPSIDVCQFQPMFHEIMSMVWMLGGLFGAISLFMRSSLSD